MAWLIVVFAALIPAATPTPRQYLEKMVAARRAFATADVRWSITIPFSATGYRRGQTDGKNWTFAYEADPDGVVQPLQLGEPFSCSVNRFLSYGGLMWNLRDDVASGMLYEWGPQRDRRLAPAAIDLRMLGILPEYDSVELDEFIDSLGTVADSALKQQDGEYGLSVIIADYGGTTVKWWLDVERGFNPIRIERRDSTGAVWADSRVELALYEGRVWYPRQIDIVEKRSYGALAARISIDAAEFDRATHPPMLTPANIGAVPLNYFSWQGPIKGPRFVFWSGSGTEFYGTKELLQRRKRGQFAQLDGAQWDERLRICGANNKGRYPAWYSNPNYGIAKPGDIDEWEKYVRRFCLIRKCDDRQKASAQGILDDCRKVATPILARIKADQAKEKDAAKREAMLAPIADIFTGVLAPRLNALLTIPQSQPTSQPAKPIPVAGR